MKIKALLQLLLIVGFTTLSALSLSGCEKKQGPLEEMGENLDEAAKDAGRALEDATD